MTAGLDEDDTLGDVDVDLLPTGLGIAEDLRPDAIAQRVVVRVRIVVPGRYPLLDNTLSMAGGVRGVRLDGERVRQIAIASRRQCG